METKDLQQIETVAEISIDTDSSASPKKQPATGLAITAFIFGIISLSSTALSFVMLGVTFIMAFIVGLFLNASGIVGFVHLVCCVPILIISIISLILAGIAKKKGNKSTVRKLSVAFGWISIAVTVVLFVVLLVSSLVMGTLDVLSFIFFTIIPLVVTAISSVVIFLVELLLGILAALGSALVAFITALAPVFTPIIGLLIIVFGEALVYGFYDFLIYIFEALFLEGGAAAFLFLL